MVIRLYFDYQGKVSVVKLSVLHFSPDMSTMDSIIHSNASHFKTSIHVINCSRFLQYNAVSQAGVFHKRWYLGIVIGVFSHQMNCRHG